MLIEASYICDFCGEEAYLETYLCGWWTLKQEGPNRQEALTFCSASCLMDSRIELHEL